MPPAPSSNRTAEKALLRRFEDAWQQGGAALTHFLTSATARSLAIELVKIDLEYRWRHAGTSSAPGPVPVCPRLEDYIAHVPQLGPSAHLPADLIAAEYSVRHWVGDRPTHEEMFRRFPAQAGQVRIELLQIDAEMAAEPTLAGSTEIQLPAATRGPLASSAEWWQAVRDNGIVAADQIETLQTRFGTNQSPESFARQLIDLRLITPFQANLLLAGRGAALLVGPYVIIEPIGEGLTSRVFRARHRHLDKVVALKVFRAELVREVSPEVLERFTREMRALASLSHENIVHAYDAGLSGANYYIAMQYVPGSDLQRLVRERGPLPPEQAADFARQVALGLAHIRAHALVHRDLKPSNLIVAKDPSGRHPRGLVQILDLGLARLHGSERTRSLGTLTRHGQVMGTADYMAPEQALDPHRIDIRADLYSLGCTLYYLLTGRPPFPGGTLSQKLNRHLNEEPVPPESLRTGIPPALVAVVRRLMAKQPAERFQTPEEVAAALGQEPAVATRRLPLGWLALAGSLMLGLLLVAVVGAVVVPRFFRSATPVGSDAKPTEEKRKRFALEFDGRSSQVSLPDDLIHDSPAITVELWFKTHTGGALFGYQHVPYPERPNLNVPLLYVGSDGILRGAVWRGAVAPLAGTSPINDGRWHHAALVSDGHSQSLYQDGTLLQSVMGDTDHLTMSKNQIGMAFMSNWPGGNGNWMGFDGQIRDVRIWQTARTAKQIGEQMAGPLTGKEPGLAAYYPCDETGDTLFDRSSHLRHGKLTGANRTQRPKWITLP